MEEFMEAKDFADVGLFENIKDSADRVGDAACQQKGDSAAWNHLQGFPVKYDSPAHQEIKPGVEPAWSVHPAEFDNNAADSNQPDSQGEDNPMNTLHKF